MDKSWEVLIVIIGVVSGGVSSIVVGVFGFFFKKLVVSMEQSINELAQSIKTLAEDGAGRDLLSNDIKNKLEQASSCLDDIKQDLSLYDIRVRQLELFRESITKAHNLQHPENKL